MAERREKRDDGPESLPNEATDERIKAKRRGSSGREPDEDDFPTGTFRIPRV